MTRTGHDGRRPHILKDLGALLGFATASHARAVAFLVALSLVAFLPGFFNVPPIDRDEARFAQATKQMIESGDYIDIRYQDEVRYKKPVGIYWLQAGRGERRRSRGCPQARTTIWLYRIPSLLGAIGAVLLTYWAALAFVSRRMAYLAGLMMATSVLLTVEARLAKTDADAAALLRRRHGGDGARLSHAIDRARHRLGPGADPVDRARGRDPAQRPADPDGGRARGRLGRIADRSARWLLRLRPLVGVLWVLILVLPWFVAIMARAGDSFLQESVGQDLLAKCSRGRKPTARRPATICCCSG